MITPGGSAMKCDAKLISGIVCDKCHGYLKAVHEKDFSLLESELTQAK